MTQGGGTRYEFDQWTHDSTFSEYDVPNSRAGLTTSYEVWFAYGIPSFFYFYANGSELEHVTAQFTPTQAYVAGELSNHLATQMAGGSSAGNHETFDSTQWFVHNAWYGLDAPSPGINSDTNSNGFGQVKNSATSYAIWDKQCTS